jgi:hypothetical protein
MNDLLKLVIDGHGGMHRWEQISRFREGRPAADLARAGRHPHRCRQVGGDLDSAASALHHVRAGTARPLPTHPKWISLLDPSGPNRHPVTDVEHGENILASVIVRWMQPCDFWWTLSAWKASPG